MTGVILGILKVIGCLLLLLVGLVLLACVLVLFVPVRYKGYAEKQPDSPLQARAELSWLLHLLHITVGRQDGDTQITLRIFGITPDMVRNFRQKRRRKKAARRKKRVAAGKEKTKKLPVDKPEKQVVNGKTKTGSQSEKTQNVKTEPQTEKTAGTECKKSPVKETKAEYTDENPADFSQKKKTEQSEKASVFVRLMEWVRHLTALPGKFAEKLRQLKKSLTDKKQTLTSLRAFINRQEVRAAASLVWKKFLRLLRAVSPRKLEGSLEFGFSDPADTGMVLAVLGALYPWYGGHVSVTPDFQQKICACTLKGSGRIYGITVLVIGLQLYFDKNIQFIIKKRKKEA